ncbi:MAG TPA: HEAT repeat domain-containing protein [Kofleriaceae bacterium]|jgi:hypothetical protein
MADVRVDELTQSMQSSSAKSRIAAVTALGRLEDKAALRPLVDALHDPNTQVRTIAAAALGKLGHKAALPALRTAAEDDTDSNVKKIAHEAAIAVAKANSLPDPFPAAAPPAKPTLAARKSGGTAGFGRQGHAVEGHPDLFVLINSTTDDSPGKLDKVTRKSHADLLRDTLSGSFKSAALVTTVAADAQRWGLDPRHLDVSVTKLEVGQAGGYIEVEAQLRLAISDDDGKMLSFLSGGAKVQVPKGTFNAKYLPQMRKEALENAMRGMFDKLLAQLRDKSQS